MRDDGGSRIRALLQVRALDENIRQFKVARIWL